MIVLFQMFGGEKGYITSDDLESILSSAFDMEEMESQALFKQVDTEGEGRITFGKFSYILNSTGPHNRVSQPEGCIKKGGMKF